jgi:hypothetical protein
MFVSQAFGYDHGEGCMILASYDRCLAGSLKWYVPMLLQRV